jgi:hypothetical protein
MMTSHRPGTIAIAALAFLLPGLGLGSAALAGTGGQSLAGRQSLAGTGSQSLAGRQSLVRQFDAF